MSKNNVSPEELKEETKQTFNKVKDEIKDANFKEETIEAKNFVKEMFMDPVATVKNVSNDYGPKLITVIIIVIALMLSNLIKNIVWSWGFTSIGDSIWNLITALIEGLCLVIIPAFIAYLFNKNKEQSLLTAISTITIANVPTIFVNVLNAIAALISGLAGIIGVINQGLEVAHIVLVYFALKTFFKEDDDLFIFKFVLIEVIVAFIMMVLRLINIC